MINKVNKKWILYSGIIALIVIIINFLNYFFYFLPAANGNRYLELTLYYTPNDIYTLAKNYGASGRNAYILSSAIINKKRITKNYNLFDNLLAKKSKLLYNNF